MSRLRCCAITKVGRRCSGGWSIREGLTFRWDPVNGAGLIGPDLVFCHRHRLLDDRLDGHVYEKLRKRVRIVHGWYGFMGHAGGHKDYNTYYRLVFARRTGDRVAPWYWARRAPKTFGDCKQMEAA